MNGEARRNYTRILAAPGIFLFTGETQQRKKAYRDCQCSAERAVQGHKPRLWCAAAMPYYTSVLQPVLSYIRERALIRAGDRVAVAVSGGADSVALLRILRDLRPELGIVLAVAHFNHGLRGEQSNADEAFVADLARHHGLQFFVGHGDVRDHALTSKLSIEAAGRELRYRWFAALAGEQRLDAIATAHTLDDQAETVLLKFLRGAGTKGLAGIYPVLTSSADEAWTKAPSAEGDIAGAPEGTPLQKIAREASGGAAIARVIRPLLCVSRQEVESYLTSLGQSWREDESNLDRRFLRNRLRHELLPLLEREFNPNIREALSDLAEIARSEEEFWQKQVQRELETRLEGTSPGLKPSLVADPDAGLKPLFSTTKEDTVPADARSRVIEQDYGTYRPPNVSTAADCLDVDGFARLPLALQRRILKSFAEQQHLTLDFEHIEKLRRCALGRLSKTELPGGRIAARVGRALCFRLPSSPQERTSYQYLLPVPGEAYIAELNLTLRAELVPAEFAPELKPGELLSLDLVGPELTVRNWQPGDRFWPAYSGSVEKLKRLFAEKRIPAGDRVTWPVVLSGEEIVWVRGFPAANTYQWRGDGAAVRIEAISG
jgi:tRNA(Ile)-lysidine synthase